MPLKITLHNNTRWGSAFSMLDHAYKLRVVSLHIWTSAALRLQNHFKPINLFLSSADQLYSHITMLRCNGQVAKKIPWSAFALSDTDWSHVVDAKMILAIRFLHLDHHD
jgi:hypothetical protein